MPHSNEEWGVSETVNPNYPLPFAVVAPRFVRGKRQEERFVQQPVRRP
jgi:hypothetical protein